jgi:hypothetical protein
MKNLLHAILLAGLLLAGCASLAPVPVNAQPALPFVLVTTAPNASQTPTPFQPIPWTPTGTLTASDLPTTDPATPTATLPATTQTELPTIDPNMLINTLAPLATIDAPGGSQILKTDRRPSTFC